MKKRLIKEVEFSKLKHSYITVKRFLEAEACVKIKSLDTKLVKDLGLYGDDNYELLEKFVDKFELGYRNFHYDKHFHSEGELFGSVAALKTLLNLSVWLPLKTIELLTLNKVKIDKPVLFQLKREAADLTLKDLLTWYIEGEYTTEAEIDYKMKT